MITVKLSELIQNEKNIKELLDIKLPVKVSYKLSRLSKKIITELQTFNEKREELIKELGEQTEGTTIQVKTENITEFTKKIGELMEIDVNLDFEPISIEELGDITMEPKYIIPWIFV